MGRVLFVSTFTFAFLFCIVLGAKAKTFCVSTTGELHAALTEAETNGESDWIKVVKGTYSGPFWYSSTEYNSIVLRGGYTPSCTARVLDPLKTVLDAGGIGNVLVIRQFGGASAHIEGFTIQNGGTSGLTVAVRNMTGIPVQHIHVFNNIVRGNKGEYGISVYSGHNSTEQPNYVRLKANIISGNRGDSVGGVRVTAAWGQGPGSFVHLADNIIVGNASSTYGGGAYIDLSQYADVWFSNNTIADNRVLESGSYAGGVYINNFGTDNRLGFYNNIIRGNFSASGVADIKFSDSTPERTGYYNNYSEISGTWTSSSRNINVDSLFVNRGYWNDNGTPGNDLDDFWVDGDFHLSKESPCIDEGYNGSPFVYPQNFDFEGDPRIVDGDNNGSEVVDIGADEYYFRLGVMPLLQLLLLGD